MTRELAEEEFRPHRPEKARKKRNAERCDSVNAEHLYRLRIVAEQHRAAVARPPPQALLAESCLPVVEIQPDVRVKEPELIHRRYWRCRGFWERVDRGYGRPRRIREWGRGRTVLILAPNISHPTTGSGPGGKPRYRIESSFVRTAIVVDERLSESVTVRKTKRLAGDLGGASVDRLEPCAVRLDSVCPFEIFLEFRVEKSKDPLSLRGSLVDPVGSFTEHPRTFAPCPGPNS